MIKTASSFACEVSFRDKSFSVFHLKVGIGYVVSLTMHEVEESHADFHKPYLKYSNISIRLQTDT